MILGSEGKVVNGIADPLRICILSLAWIAGVPITVGLTAGVVDTPFIQEYHEAYAVGRERGCNDVRAIAVDSADRVWAGTGAGVYRFDRNKPQWVGLSRDSEAGPVYDMVVDRAGAVWVGAWNGMYLSAPDG